MTASLASAVNFVTITVKVCHVGEIHNKTKIKIKRKINKNWKKKKSCSHKYTKIIILIWGTNGVC